MIIRRPTKIELKPEDDYSEYEEYKRKLAESARQSRGMPQGGDLMKLGAGKGIGSTDKMMMVQEPGFIESPFRGPAADQIMMGANRRGGDRSTFINHLLNMPSGAPTQTQFSPSMMGPPQPPAPGPAMPGAGGFRFEPPAQIGGQAPPSFFSFQSPGFSGPPQSGSGSGSRAMPPGGITNEHLQLYTMLLNNLVQGGSGGGEHQYPGPGGAPSGQFGMGGGSSGGQGSSGYGRGNPGGNH